MLLVRPPPICMAWGQSCAAPSAIPCSSAWCMPGDATGWICGACASSRSAWRRGYDPGGVAYRTRREEGALLMILGYTRPLYLLPFDHRGSYISGLFGWKEPLNVEQMVTVANSKHVIYEGFQQAIADQMPKDRLGLLVDEEFGAAILRDAVSKGYITVASVEK